MLGQITTEPGITHRKRWLAEASDSTTPAERLRELGQRHQSGATDADIAEVRSLLARNPSTPPDLLAELAPDHWPSFLHNPVAPLLPLECPDFWDSVDRSGLRSVLRNADTPRWLLEQLSQFGRRDRALAQEARLHVGLVGEVGTLWQESLRDTLRQIAAEATPPEREAYREMVELDIAPAWLAGPDEESVPAVEPVFPGDETDPSRRFIARWEAQTVEEAADSQTSRTCLRRLAEGWPHTWPGIARNASAPADLLRLLAQKSAPEKSPDVWRALARNPATPAEVVRRCLHADDPAIRRGGRVHPAAPKKAADTCRKTALESALRWEPFAALHVDSGYPPATPPAARTAVPALARLAALLHRQTPHERVAAGMRSDFWLDRLAAALRYGRHSPLPLLGDGNIFVRAAARARLEDSTLRFDL